MAPFVDTGTREQKRPMCQINETYLFLRLADQKQTLEKPCLFAVAFVES